MTARTMCVGRAGELRTLRDAFTLAADRRVAAALVKGAPGIGKTSLVEEFLRSLDGAQVLRASGDAPEKFVSLGIVDQLLRVAGGCRPELLAPESRAADDQVAVGLRILDLAGRLQDDGPLVIAIDDAQWADEASLRALLFAVRRMFVDAVLLILIVRAGEASALPEGLVRLAAGTTVDAKPLLVSEIRQLAEAERVTLTPRARATPTSTPGADPGQIPNGISAFFGFFGGYSQAVPMYTSPQLPPGLHTLVVTVTVTGTQDTTATGSTVAIDSAIASEPAVTSAGAKQ